MSTLSCWLVGSDTLLLECAQALLDADHDLRGVVTDQPRIRSWCQDRGLQVVDGAGDWPAVLREAEPFDVLFAITWLKVVPDEALALPRRMAVNFHDGPLPRYAGLNTPVWGLLNQESEWGITWHVMTPGVDEGDVLKQERFPLSPGETALSLNTRCLAAALSSFPELVAEIAGGREERTPQDLSLRTVYRRTDRPPAACLVDWTAPTDRILTVARALTFGPHPNPVGLPKTVSGRGGEAVVVDELVSVTGASTGTSAPGEVLSVDEEGLVVATGDGAVAIRAGRALDGKVLEPRALAQRIGAAPGGRLAVPGDPVWEDLDRADGTWGRHEAFWTRRLRSGESPELPVGTPGAPVSGWTTESLPLPEEVREGFGDELPWAIAAATAVLLARLGPRDRISLSTAAGDGLPEEVYAPFVPVQVELDPEESFGTLVSRVVRDAEAARERGGFLRDLPLRLPEVGARGLQAPVVVGAATPGRDAVEAAEVVLAVAPSPDGSALDVSFAQGPLGPESARRVATSLLACLVAAAEDPHRRWTTLPLVTEEERARLDGAWNATGRDYDRSARIHDLVRRQVERTPDRIALSFEGRRITYRELADRVDALAGVLIARGVGPDTLVGVHVDRSLELPVAVLAVLQAGAAYLPLDPDFPADRLAFMLEDAEAAWVLTRRELAGSLPPGFSDRLVWVDGGPDAGSPPRDASSGGEDTRSSHLAYAIYTSGSTGTPKGVLVEHRNVVNFFAAMDEVVEVPEEGGVWLAVTSLSFDISVLELLWTLTRGFEVVIHRDRTRETAAALRHAHEPMAFGLFMWGNDDGPGPSKYRLMLEGARFFDENGFDSVWTPERHFHAFGGPFPNPSVTGAALAATTSNLRIRSGSCVSPLHHPIRIAEEWGVVDNLSGGRVGLSFAAGWQPNDFVIRPESFGNQKALMVEQIDVVRRLWRGEKVEFENPTGERVAITTLPRPVQPELPVWVTTAGNVDTYRLAGTLGANILTHLLGQSLEEVSEKIAAYREARAEAGFDPDTGIVTLMLHTFVGDSDDAVRERVREPMKDYLRSSMKLILGFAWTFPAFKRPGGAQAESPEDVDLSSLTDDEVEAILDFAFDRYFENSGLFGTPETCAVMVDRCKGAGVDEIACLLDFGVDTDRVLESLPLLKRVRDEANRGVGAEASGEGEPASFPELVRDRGVTHLQCTPSMARMLSEDPGSRAALGSIPHLLVGGEAFPAPLAEQLRAGSPASVTNMYGPTETTIWSLTHRLNGDAGPVPIGRPVANTRVHVLDRFLQPVPPGVPGHLYIGGDGVARGYHRRPELTAERFVRDPSRDGDHRMYQTGDLVRWRDDGAMDFLGRVDHQVKIRGYRIELGEIEATLDGVPGIAASAVVLREDAAGEPRLEAFVVAEDGPLPESQLKDALRASLPEYMVPSRITHLDRLPLTPNGKIDRKALPESDTMATVDRVASYVAPESGLEETVAACWRATLGQERIGVEDNFFDIGGHSLLVVRLHRELQHSLDSAPTLVDLYRFPTIRALTRHLSEDGDDGEHLQASEDRASQRRKMMARRRRRGS